MLNITDVKNWLTKNEDEFEIVKYKITEKLQHTDRQYYVHNLELEIEDEMIMFTDLEGIIWELKSLLMGFYNDDITEIELENDYFIIYLGTGYIQVRVV